MDLDLRFGKPRFRSAAQLPLLPAVMTALRSPITGAQRALCQAFGGARRDDLRGAPFRY